MPNTAVKPANAESTWGEAPWEDRKPLITKREQCIGTALFLYTTTSHLPRASPGISREPVLKERQRRAKLCESLMSGPCVSSTCHEDVFMCADPTDRCDDRQQETYTVCMRSFFVYGGSLSFQIPGISISREPRLKEQSDAQTVVSRLLRIGTHEIEC